jgi:CheY-like chemotaxis protein
MAWPAQGEVWPGLRKGRSAVTEQKPKQKLFIVEDDAELSEMLAVFFRTQGYTVEQALRGEAALQRINANPPDLVLLDIRLPDIDGYEVCRRLRGNRRTHNLPVLFLTEKRDRHDKLSGLELGAVDYITKPFDMMELRLRIRNALRRTSFHSLNNPITGLPERALLEEQLAALAQRADWGVTLVRLHGLNKFRDRYGFVATDDVSRALALMITNTVKEDDGDEPFIGHLDASSYLIVTTHARCQPLAQRCRARLEPAVTYFYPALDRPRVQALPATERLSVTVHTLTAATHPFTDLASFLADLLD